MPNRRTRLEVWRLRAYELWSEPLAKAAAGFAAAVAALILAYVLGYVPDPWNSRSRGPGWECYATGAGVRTCAKDVPAQRQKPRR
jgi:hypothetical protein